MKLCRNRALFLTLVLALLLSLITAGALADATPTPAPATETTNATGMINRSGGTNFRKDASFKGALLEKLDKGVVVELLSIPSVISEETWYQVRYAGKVGYINAPFITVISSGGITPKPTHSSSSDIEIEEGQGYVKLILSSCHLRTAPNGSFDHDKDWEQKGGTLPMAGQPVTKDGKTWYPVKKDGKVWYVLSTCVEVIGSYVTPTPAPSSDPTPVPVAWGQVQTVKSGCNLRNTPAGTTIVQIPKGETLKVLDAPVNKSGYTWYHVQYKNLTGYLRHDVVKVISSGATPSPAPVVTPTPAPTEKPMSSYVITTLDKVNLRVGPSKSTEAKARAEKKGTVMRFSTTQLVGSTTWYQIEYNKATLWVIEDCVRVMTQAEYEAMFGPATTPPSTTATPEPTVSIQGYVKTTAVNVNLRTNVVESKIIGRVPAKGTILPMVGDPVPVKGVTWYYVKHPTLGTGYIHGDYVTYCDSNGNPIAKPTTTPSGGSKQEASYTTLKLGSTGAAVTALVTELKNQGYYDGTVVSTYNTAVEKAVKAFQKAKGLSEDGIAGANTQHALYGTVPIGQGDSSDLSMTLYAAEKIDWFNGGIQSLWPKGANFKIYDVKTGIVWWAHRWAGYNHVDAEPLTAADTARLCKIYGVSKSAEIASKNLYQRRPCLITIGTRTFACSLYGIPHNYPDGDTISTNDFKGQLCIHFTNSKTSDSNKVDSGHQTAIQEAWESAPNGHK